MPNERIGLFIGGGQLLIALLLWFGIDSTAARKAIPKLNAKSKIVLILLIGGLAFSGYAFYQITFAHPTPDNVEGYVIEWTSDLHLLNHKLKPSDAAYPTYWGYEIGIEPEHMVTVWRNKEKPNYLFFSKSVTFPPVLQKMFEMTPKTVMNLFGLEYVAELSKARTHVKTDSPLTRFDIERLLPITKDLNEVTFLNTLNEMFQDEAIAWTEVPLCLMHAGATGGLLGEHYPISPPTPSPTPH
jgi:hypothetical protein